MVPQGVVYGFLGPNGAGKTTAMRILVGLLRADGGTIRLFGEEVCGRRRPLERIGALIEGPTFYPYLSGRDNLRVVASVGPRPGGGRIDEVLKLVDLTSRADDRYSAYSLGMRQRLGIAAALLDDPPLLLLDEPANGLDPAGIVAMRHLLRRLASEGRTILVSSHILGEMQQLADEVAIIDRGHLVRQGRLSQMLGDGSQLRIRVRPADAAAAHAALIAMLGRGAIRPASEAEGDGWLVVSTAQPGSEVNQRLAAAGVFAERLEGGDKLEHLFLEITGGQT
jgi:ABC-2 type transport system ATP-binding protein